MFMSVSFLVNHQPLWVSDESLAISSLAIIVSNVECAVNTVYELPCVWGFPWSFSPFPSLLFFSLPSSPIPSPPLLSPTPPFLISFPFLPSLLLVLLDQLIKQPCLVKESFWAPAWAASSWLLSESWDSLSVTFCHLGNAGCPVESPLELFKEHASPQTWWINV